MTGITFTVLYMLINGFNALVIKLSNGRFVPENYEQREK